MRFEELLANRTELPPERFENTSRWADVLPTQEVSVLGYGKYGFAFDLHDGRVLKITSDDSEARTSLFLLNKEHKNVAKILKIAKYKSQTVVGQYFIIMKKYKENDLDENFFDAALEELDVERASGYPRATTKDYWKIPKDEHELYNRLRPALDPNSSHSSQVTLKFVKVLLDIRAGLEYLKKNNIVFKDAHYANILMDDAGNYVISDLGNHSISRASEYDIPLLEVLI